MNLSISTRDFNKICRICLQKKKGMSILLNSEISCVVCVCTSLQENNKMPKKICYDCYEELKNVCKFKQKYIESTQTLTQIIRKAETQIINNENNVQKKKNCEFETADNEEFILCVVADDDEKLNINFNDLKTQIDSNILNFLNENSKKLDLNIVSDTINENRCEFETNISDIVNVLNGNNEKIDVNIKNGGTNEDKYEFKTIDSDIVNVLNRNNEKLNVNIQNGQTNEDKCELKTTDSDIVNVLNGNTKTFDVNVESDVINDDKCGFEINDDIESDGINEDKCEFETTDSEEYELCEDEGDNEISYDNFDYSKTQMGNDVANNLNENLNNVMTTHVTNDMNIRTNLFNKREYICDICGKKSKKLAHFRNHKIMHTNIRAYECSKCLRTFKHPSALNDHLRVKHTDAMKYCKYICDICDKKYLTQSKLKRHQLTHSNERPYVCTLCQKTFKHKMSLTEHTKAVHCEQDMRERRVCYVCGKLIILYDFSQHLVQHEPREHTNKYKCEICDRPYANKTSLQKHIQYKHTNAVIPVHCDICNKMFSSKYILSRHKTNVHTNERRFKCKMYLCDKSYKVSAHLKQHIRNVHNDVRPHKCSTCNKAFYTDMQLRKHMVCHTGERPYTCEVCGKSFGFSSALYTHQKVHSK